MNQSVAWDGRAHYARLSGSRALRGAMSDFVIRQIPVLRDNYVYLLHDEETGATGAVDPSVAGSVLRVLDETALLLTHILGAHHHPYHTGGNLEIKQATGATIVGP